MTSNRILFPGVRICIVAMLTAVAAVVAGCGQQLSNVDLLDRTLAYYHVHLVSGEIHRAAGYVEREAIDEFLSRHDPEQNIFEWEDFTILSVAYSGDGEGKQESATAVVRARVRRHDSITIQTRQFREKWKYSGGHWMLQSEETIEGNDLKAGKDTGRNVLDGEAGSDDRGAE